MIGRSGELVAQADAAGERQARPLTWTSSAGVQVAGGDGDVVFGAQMDDLGGHGLELRGQWTRGIRVAHPAAWVSWAGLRQRLRRNGIAGEERLCRLGEGSRQPQAIMARPQPPANPAST